MACLAGLSGSWSTETPGFLMGNRASLLPAVDGSVLLGSDGWRAAAMAGVLEGRPMASRNLRMAAFHGAAAVRTFGNIRLEHAGWQLGPRDAVLSTSVAGGLVCQLVVGL